MTVGETMIGGRAAELRRAFDHSFSEAPRVELVHIENLIAIRVAGHPYAVRLAEISGLFADKIIVRLPSPMTELVGVAGFRGAIVPIYDLRALLGHPATQAPRWLLLATAETPVGLAFDQVDGHLQVARELILAQEDRTEPSRHVREVVRAADVARPIVHVPSVVEAIKKTAHQGVAKQEK